MIKQLPGFIILMLCFLKAYSSEIIITPTGTDDDTELIQTALDGLNGGDTLCLNGDFFIAKTIYLPSNFTWKLTGTLTLAADAVLDEVGWVETGVDARRRTGISEKSGGATNIDMSGGTYYGNASNYPNSMRFINFVSVTHSVFYDMHITDATDDNFTLGPGCNNNECHRLIGSFAGGNALTDKGDYNKWYDCIAEDCASDGWTPKCRYSEFHRCIGRRNAAPGFGMFARLDGSGDPVDLGEIIVGNKFYDCESYDNGRGGFSFNIAGTSGHGSIIRDNYIQAVCYNNEMQGVAFRNKQDDGIVENNIVDIVVYGNKGHNSSGSISNYAGGLSTEGLISGLTGSVVAYDNGGYDVNINSGSNCTITAYQPLDQNQAVLNIGTNGNTIYSNDFNCSDLLNKWCQHKYCGTSTPPFPASPSNLLATVTSSSQIDLSWEDNGDVEDGFIIELKLEDIYKVIAKLDANVTSFSHTDLTELTEYTYRVQAFNISGYSEYTNEISATTEGNTNTSSKGFSEGNSMSKIYPNPFNETSHIAYNLPKDCFVSIKLYNSAGRELKTLIQDTKEKGVNTTSFYAGDMPGGTYFYRICAGDIVETKKIILLK